MVADLRLPFWVPGFDEGGDWITEEMKTMTKDQRLFCFCLNDHKMHKQMQVVLEKTDDRLFSTIQKTLDVWRLHHQNPSRSKIQGRPLQMSIVMEVWWHKKEFGGRNEI